jgi:hypothetical protein
MRMTKQEIIDLINNNTSKNNKLSLNDLSDLKKVAYVFLGIDDTTYDYLYKVKVDELVDKEFRKELLTDYNWILSKDENFILLYF